MRRTLKPWQHALASLALTAGVFGIAWALLLLPAGRLQEANQDRIQTLEQQLLRYRQAALSVDELRQAVISVKQNNGNSDRFMTGTEPALAAAEVQRLLRDLSEKHQGQVLSSQPLLQETESSYPRITIKISMRGSIQALHGILYDIAATESKLTINNLVVQQRRSARHTSEDAEPQLDIRFDVVTYLSDMVLAQG